MTPQQAMAVGRNLGLARKPNETHADFVARINAARSTAARNVSTADTKAIDPRKSNKLGLVLQLSMLALHFMGGPPPPPTDVI